MSEIRPRTLPHVPSFSKEDDKRYMRTFRDAPYCEGCGKPNDGTIVGCHVNSVGLGSGIGIKTWGAVFAGCSTCHDIVDGRAIFNTAAREQILTRVLQTVLIERAQEWAIYRRKTEG